MFHRYNSLYASHRQLVDEAIFGAWSRGELKASISASAQQQTLTDTGAE